MSKTGHIVAIKAGRGAGEYSPKIGFNLLKASLTDDLSCESWLGPRPALELMSNGVEEARAANNGEKHDLATGQLLLPAFLQVIPYIVFRHNGLYMRYLRTTTGGDSRLHGRISIGIGGHIDLFDAVVAEDGSLDLIGTLNRAALREALEETGVAISAAPEWMGILYAPETAVDTVHIGIVGIIDLSDEQYSSIAANHEIGDHRFSTFAEIEAEARDNTVMETWTRVVIQSTLIA